MRLSSSSANKFIKLAPKLLSYSFLMPCSLGKISMSVSIRPVDSAEGPTPTIEWIKPKGQLAELTLESKSAVAILNYFIYN